MVTKILSGGVILPRKKVTGTNNFPWHNTAREKGNEMHQRVSNGDYCTAQDVAGFCGTRAELNEKRAPREKNGACIEIQ